jgi:hypothetical protein
MHDSAGRYGFANDVGDFGTGFFLHDHFRIGVFLRAAGMVSTHVENCSFYAEASDNTA